MTAPSDTLSLQREMKWPQLNAFDSLQLCRSLGMITRKEYQLAHLEISLLQDFGVETKPEEVDSLILRLRK